ncbi:Glutathione-binding protein GsiB precursor [Sulfitobacter sp. THAF37]|uniref:ABC transporter substrate-binding protein n=1 Tax=Sulfitobacter sp. THAF37 TaxID=2587855 RepID=UPI0012694174|nr:ABC transporter substrate-binding protein [Sulfitobacter sp. THAF37]QFT59485.1 Glutathione-binding protein GsiB precursor [Sulfitobacter sp. THAF37]
MKLKTLMMGSALGLAIAAPAFADKSDDTLRLAFLKELESVDNYFNSAREGILISRAVWDGLLYRDPDTGEFKGNLATEWTWIDDVTIELKLREGVTFHNGEPFNADDVVYTVNYVTNPDNGIKVSANVNWMKSAEKVDDYTVRINLVAPFPPAEEYLAGPVVMYPNEYYEEVGPTGMATAPIGTGPYKVDLVEPGQLYELSKFEDYHDSPKGEADIGKIEVKTIPDMNTQVAELFNGGLDFLWNVPADQAEKLAEMEDRFEVVNAQAIRIGYITIDAAGASDPDGPMTDKKVRQAIYHAIDRQAIVDALVKGSSEVVNAGCAPIQFGCDQSVKTYDYDPEKAKALLAEAGYPDGFEIDFYAYRDRPYAEALMGFLNEVGITTNFNYLKYAALREKREKKEVPISFQTWGSYSLADVSAITGEFFTGGPLDDAMDPEVIEWVKEAGSVTDRAKREELYSKAHAKIAEEAYWVPLWTYNVNYVLSNELAFTPTDDEIVRFADFSWK